MHKFVLIFALLLTLSVPFNARCDTPQILDRLYVSNRQSLVTFRARQATVDHNILSILPSPSGLRVGFIRAVTDGDTTTTTFSTIAPAAAHYRDYYSVTGTGDGFSSLDFGAGWSSDSRFLALTNSSATPADYTTDIVIVDFVTGKATPLRKNFSGDLGVWGSSDRLLAAVNDTSERGILLYDARSQNTTLWSVAGARIYNMAWRDNSHASFLQYTEKGGRKNELMDLATGLVTTESAGLHANSPTVSPPDSVSVHVPQSDTAVTLQALTIYAPEALEDGASHPSAATIYITVTGLPSHPVKRVRKTNLLVDSFVADGDYPGANESILLPPSNPSSFYAAYIEHGDLYFSQIGFTKATPRELSSAGEVLTCDEEALLAADNAKQIGLAIIQYAEDNDEKFPDADTFSDGVKPYLGTDAKSILISDIYSFHYTMPGDGMASIDSPADTPMGTYDLPCGKVVLFCDGHVKWFPVQEGLGTFQGWPTN